MKIQKVTKPYKTFEELDAKHQKAVMLRLEFWKHKYIATDLKMSEAYVRSLFAKDGLCYGAYQDLKRLRTKENKDMMKDARQELTDLVPEAIIVVKDSLRKRKDPETAFKVLGIHGISPIEKHEVDTKNKEKIDTISSLIDELTTHVKLTGKGNSKSNTAAS